LNSVNQLVFVIVSGRQADALSQALVKEAFYFTKFDISMFAFQETTLCLMIGLNSSKHGKLIQLVEEHCQPHQEYVPVQFTPPAGFPPLSMIEARVGGALVYSVDVETFEQY
ncbi:MAG: cyclic-di-AMP receptor, partial [Anaerolineaceae bacterium]|nr:cyclic-di-AMP receptor [Anaerolineaceae bacterium]